MEIRQAYLSARGSKSFIQDASQIPYAINNDTTLSGNAAELVFQSLVAADAAGTLEPDIFVLELGVGVGLFARYFLDAFRHRSAAEGKDYYERLQYVAGDYAGRMLLDACRHGIFANHPGRYLLRPVNALDPEAGLRDDPLLGSLERPFRAVFLNYLLDCLPATVLKIGGQAPGDGRQRIEKGTFWLFVPEDRLEVGQATQTLSKTPTIHLIRRSFFSRGHRSVLRTRSLKEIIALHIVQGSIRGARGRARCSHRPLSSR
jgi:hypothetical protein